MLYWSTQYGIFLFADSNEYNDAYGQYDCVLAAGCRHSIQGSDAGLLTRLQDWHDAHKDWLFGHICYDYKNALEPSLKSRHATALGWDEFFFFQPQVVCTINKERTMLSIACMEQSPQAVYADIRACENTMREDIPGVTFSRKTDKTEYTDNIEQLRQHIKNGDCYEINYCVEGFAENVRLQPLPVYQKLNGISPAPFSAFYKNEHRYMMCASMERYLCKRGSELLSQPIKGTIRRGATTDADEAQKNKLYNSIKDRAENVMIVDLVRNDLARCCEQGSVAVKELYGIYTFPQVHQMISTVSGTLARDRKFTDALRYTFPMGSMTGAPKIIVTKLADRYESSRRELYSGTVGYITPEGDFDFNVVIRSMFYNEETRYLSYHTGGAITYDSAAEDEWDEMRLKASAIEQVFAR